MKRKRVFVRSHGPLAAYPDVQIGWEDVWLRVHSGRRVLKLAPCLVSRNHLLSDIVVYSSRAPGDLYNDLAELKKMLAEVDSTSSPVISTKPRINRKGRDPGYGFGTAEVYTSSPWLNKAEAERMIEAYLDVLGLRNCVFKWKTSRLRIWPTTIDHTIVIDSLH